MTVPAPLSAGEILERLTPLLVASYEDDTPAVLPTEPRGQRARDLLDYVGAARLTRARQIRGLIAECRRAGITPRLVSSRTRLPGLWVLCWWPYPADRAAAYQAEVHHLDRALNEARRERAAYAAALVADRTIGYVPDPDLVRSPTNHDGKPLTKVAVAELFSVSRPTLDGWIDDAHADTSPTGTP